MAILISFNKKESKILVSGDDSICFFVCLWKFELKPQNGPFFIILSDYVSFPKRPVLPLAEMLSFFACLFLVVAVFLHRILPHVVLVVDEVVHQVHVIMAVFNPTLNLFFSAVQIYDFTIYCKSALEFVTKKKNISAHARHSDTKNN